MCLSEINGIYLNQSDVLLKFNSLVHGFTGRQGGVSKGEYESLSLSPRRGDDIECVRKNEEILSLLEKVKVFLEKLTMKK